MKVKLTLIALILATVLATSCRVKESCELNHTGVIELTNNTTNTLEVYVDNIKVFTVDAGESNSIVKPVGTYEVKYIDYPEEHIFSTDVFECETAEIIVSE